jgi:hypothetical protein
MGLYADGHPPNLTTLNLLMRAESDIAEVAEKAQFGSQPFSLSNERRNQ